MRDMTNQTTKAPTLAELRRLAEGKGYSLDMMERGQIEALPHEDSPCPFIQVRFYETKGVMSVDVRLARIVLFAALSALDYVKRGGK